MNDGILTRGMDKALVELRIARDAQELPTIRACVQAAIEALFEARGWRPGWSKERGEAMGWQSEYHASIKARR